MHRRVLFQKTSFWPCGRPRARINNQPGLFCNHLHWSRARILPDPQGRMVGTLRANTAAPARGDCTISLSPVRCLQPGGAAEGTGCSAELTAGSTQALLLGQGQVTDLPTEGVSRWRMSCSRWLSCRRQREGCVTSGRPRRS